MITSQRLHRLVRLPPPLTAQPVNSYLERQGAIVEFRGSGDSFKFLSLSQTGPSLRGRNVR
jgi:hypothetical protein